MTTVRPYKCNYSGGSAEGPAKRGIRKKRILKPCLVQESNISAKVRQSCSSVLFSLQSKQLQPDYVSSYEARSVFARVAVRNHGYKGTEVAKVAKVLSLSPPSVSRIVENADNILDNQKHIAVKIAHMES